MLGWQAFLELSGWVPYDSGVWNLIYKVTDGYFNWLQKKTEKY